MARQGLALPYVKRKTCRNRFSVGRFWLDNDSRAQFAHLVVIQAFAPGGLCQFVIEIELDTVITRLFREKCNYLVKFISRNKGKKPIVESDTIGAIVIGFTGAETHRAITMIALRGCYYGKPDAIPDEPLSGFNIICYCH